MSLTTPNFALGDDVDALRDAVRHFAQSEIAPMAAEVDHVNAFPAAFWPNLGEFGMLGLTVEECYGGSNMGYLAHVVAMEEISPRLRFDRVLLRRPFQSLREPVQQKRQRGAKAEVPA